MGAMPLNCPLPTFHLLMETGFSSSAVCALTTLGTQAKSKNSNCFIFIRLNVKNNVSRSLSIASYGNANRTNSTQIFTYEWIFNVYLRGHLLIQHHIHDYGLSCHKHSGQSTGGDDAFRAYVGQTHTPVFYDIPSVILWNIQITINTNV